MGGSGSGRWADHPKKVLVESCWSLDIHLLKKWGLIYWPTRAHTHHRSLVWGHPRGGPTTVSASYRLEPVDEAQFTLTLWYRRQGREIELSIAIQTTPQRFGGHRWWFTCPLGSKRMPCQQRVRTLYLPPGAPQFGCRSCHDLTYRSSRESHHLDAAAQRYARRLGLEVGEVRTFMESLGPIELAVLKGLKGRALHEVLFTDER